MFLFAVPFVLQAIRVCAHGYVSQITIDGNEYAGNAPGHDTVSSPIRTVATDGPVQNTSSSELGCGIGALNAQFDAVAGPGSSVNFTWVSGSGGSWPHVVGPILTYLASCDNTTSCDEFNTSDAQWFKIDEAGKKSDDVAWVQQDIMEGSNFNVSLPENLAPGAYLIRNEIIGLQNAMSPGGAEFFPSCTQLRVIGNETGVPSPNDTVSLPGAYHATDPGILFDAYTDPHNPYVFPGPPVATLVAAAAEDTDESYCPPPPGSDETFEEPMTSLPIAPPPYMGDAPHPVLAERERYFHSRVVMRAH